jgi:glycosyltransferase involved in cell wall biosynthesis
MTRVLCFKPGVANNRTAFEAMATIYNYLERNYNYDFTIVNASADTYDHEDLDIISIANSWSQKATWKAAQYFGQFPASGILPKKMDRYFHESDVVITVNPTTRQAGVVGIKKAVATDTPVWFDVGRTTMQPFDRYLWKLRKRVFSQAVHASDGIIATSPKVLEYFRDINLFDKEIANKFTIIGHPTDTTKFLPKRSDHSNHNENIQIITVSRLIPEKGLYYLIEALDPILSKHSNIGLTIIGDGPMKSLLEREVQTRELSDSIDFKGTVPHSQIPILLQNSDIFVNHSLDVAGWEEFFGAANIEAMACGLPCVLTNSGSVPYVARVPEGVKLVAQRDVVDIRQKVEELIKNPSKRKKIGEEARAFVEQNYSIEAISEKYHRMLQQEIKG